MGVMALPELDIKRVERWCAAKVPANLLDQIRVECDIAPRHLTVMECRPPWREDFGPEWTPAFRSHDCTTPRPVVIGSCTGATATWTGIDITMCPLRNRSRTSSTNSAPTRTLSSGDSQPVAPTSKTFKLVSVDWHQRTRAGNQARTQTAAASSLGRFRSPDRANSPRRIPAD